MSRSERHESAESVSPQSLCQGGSIRRARTATPGRSGEEGWALLGLMLAMSILLIVLSSAVVPNVQMQVRRDKEIEMVYRGEQMADGIARYYGRGALTPLQLLVPPQYGYLTELKKLREGVRLGIREIKFVRPSAFIDPMTSVEWEPVRARDPRIMKYLQAYAAETQTLIPNQYMLIAGPPQKLHLATRPAETDSSGARPGQQQPAPGQQPSAGTQPGRGRVVQPPQNPVDADEGDDDDDDDDDDDENTADPLAHLFSSTDSPGRSNVPIVGVAPALKGKAVMPRYGLENYEDWVFIFIPKQIQFNQVPGGGTNRRSDRGVPVGPLPPPPPGGRARPIY